MLSALVLLGCGGPVPIDPGDRPAAFPPAPSTPSRPEPPPGAFVTLTLAPDASASLRLDLGRDEVAELLGPLAADLVLLELVPGGAARPADARRGFTEQHVRVQLVSFIDACRRRACLNRDQKGDSQD